MSSLKTVLIACMVAFIWALLKYSEFGFRFLLLVRSFCPPELVCRGGGNIICGAALVVAGTTLGSGTGGVAVFNILGIKTSGGDVGTCLGFVVG